ncbi:MAG TPA: type II secretion system F family protein [Bacillota bacterium]|nr:type II secretion system F family protein [Bacillota bacterium]HPP60214.1 type II secretion system F family protein [Bacillota bacterium]HQD73895.1 type II secretion system F family protein [Bacillota bacterium]
MLLEENPKSIRKVAGVDEMGHKLQLCVISLDFALFVAIPLLHLLYRRDIRLFGKPDSIQKRTSEFFSKLWDRMWRRRRTQEILAQWPTFLEEIAITVMAGMDVRSAFTVCCSKTSGYFRKICDKTVLKLQSGASLAVALSSMEKEGVEPASRLRVTLVQAESLGTPIADALNALSEEYYVLTQQQFETRLNGLPLKLSIITVLFLLPPILVISVAPHVLAFLRTGW